ncbi:MAG: alpha-amylase family glycosyl hydrolase [Pseudomonadota bacterium]
MDNGNDWWRGAVIYQIYPRSFQDSTGSGLGDLPGIAARLDHVARLGAEAIWISPFFTSPMADMGYDVSDYTGVDPLFGTLADFDAVIERAHTLGLKVIIDQVLSHTSDAHAWFRESRTDRSNPKADWYVWADPQADGTAPNNWLSVFGGPAWEWDGVRHQYYLHNFLASQPDLNFHNPEVQDALLEAVEFWLKRGVDGFRLDTANFFFHDKKLRSNPPASNDATGGIGADAPNVNPYGMQNHLYSKSQPENIAFLERLRALMDQYGATTTVGEVGDARAIELVGQYTSTGRRLHMCYTFDLLSERFSAEYLRTTVTQFENVLEDGWVCWAFSNHDVIRHVSRWEGEGRDPEALARFSIQLLAGLRGSLCLYQGEEIGMTEADIAFEDLQDPYGKRFWPAYKGRDGCRTPMVWDDGPNGSFTDGDPWLPVPDSHRVRAVAVQEADPTSVLTHYRAVLAWRHDNAILRSGTQRFGDTTGNTLWLERELDDKILVLIYNFGVEPVEQDVPGLHTANLPGATGQYDGETLVLPGLGAFAGWRSA